MAGSGGSLQGKAGPGAPIPRVLGSGSQAWSPFSEKSRPRDGLSSPPPAPIRPPPRHGAGVRLVPRRDRRERRRRAPRTGEPRDLPSLPLREARGVAGDSACESGGPGSAFASAGTGARRVALGIGLARPFIPQTLRDRAFPAGSGRFARFRTNRGGRDTTAP